MAIPSEARTGDSRSAIELINFAQNVGCNDDRAVTGIDVRYQDLPSQRRGYERRLAVTLNTHAGDDRVLGAVPFAVDYHYPLKRRDWRRRRLRDTAMLHVVEAPDPEGVYAVKSVALQRGNPHAFIGFTALEMPLRVDPIEAIRTDLLNIPNPFLNRDAEETADTPCWSEASSSDLYGMDEAAAVVRGIGARRLLARLTVNVPGHSPREA